MNVIQKAVALQLGKSILHGLKIFLGKSEDFKEMADKLLNAAEGMFPEGSLADELTETATEILRDHYGVEDSDPDN